MHAQQNKSCNSCFPSGAHRALHEHIVLFDCSVNGGVLWRGERASVVYEFLRTRSTASSPHYYHIIISHRCANKQLLPPLHSIIVRVHRGHQ